MNFCKTSFNVLCSLLSVLLENYYEKLKYYCGESSHCFGNAKITCFIPVQNGNIKKRIIRHV